MTPQSVFIFCPKCSGDFLRSKEDIYVLICKECHFKFYINPAPAVDCIIENTKEEILLIRRKFEPAKNKLDVPGGFVEPYEDMKDALIRELQEELHITCNEFSFLDGFYDTYLYEGLTKPVLRMFYTARIESEELIVDDDVSDYLFFPKERILKQQFAFESTTRAIKKFLYV